MRLLIWVLLLSSEMALGDFFFDDYKKERTDFHKQEEQLFREFSEKKEKYLEEISSYEKAKTSINELIEKVKKTQISLSSEQSSKLFKVFVAGYEKAGKAYHGIEESLREYDQELVSLSKKSAHIYEKALENYRERLLSLNKRSESFLESFHKEKILEERNQVIAEIEQVSSEKIMRFNSIASRIEECIQMGESFKEKIAGVEKDYQALTFEIKNDPKNLHFEWSKTELKCHKTHLFNFGVLENAGIDDCIEQSGVEIHWDPAAAVCTLSTPYQVPIPGEFSLKECAEKAKYAYVWFDQFCHKVDLKSMQLDKRKYTLASDLSAFEKVESQHCIDMGESAYHWEMDQGVCLHFSKNSPDLFTDLELNADRQRKKLGQAERHKCVYDLGVPSAKDHQDEIYFTSFTDDLLALFAYKKDLQQAEPELREEARHISQAFLQHYQKHKQRILKYEKKKKLKKMHRVMFAVDEKIIDSISDEYAEDKEALLALRSSYYSQYRDLEESPDNPIKIMKKYHIKDKGEVFKKAVFYYFALLHHAQLKGKQSALAQIASDELGEIKSKANRKSFERVIRRKSSSFSDQYEKNHQTITQFLQDTDFKTPIPAFNSDMQQNLELIEGALCQELKNSEHTAMILPLKKPKDMLKEDCQRIIEFIRENFELNSLNHLSYYRERGLCYEYLHRFKLQKVSRQLCRSEPANKEEDD